MKARRRKTTKRRRSKASTARRRHGSPAAGSNRNVALLTHERDELLEQLTATSEVLRVISSSPADLQPVLDAVAQSAAKLCEAYDAVIWLPDGDWLRLVAHHGPILVESIPLVRGNVGGRSVLDKQTIHIADVQTENDEFPVTSKNARKWGFRTVVCVPLMREGVAYGAISLRRKEAQLFTKRQVALLETFAAQAVIAIENTRLLNELRQRTDDLSESLEQQTATCEVLKVISSSPGDLQPVFDAMLAKATKLCEASYGVLWLWDGSDVRAAALHGALPEAYLERLRGGAAFRARPDRPGTRAMTERRPIQVADLREETAYLARDPLAVTAADDAGIRTLVSVPMYKDDQTVGNITIYRREVRPFSEKQVDLLANFAAQAVIAIENTRLLNELRQRTDDLSESLEQQTATSEVLKVISSSPGELQPVFESMLANATHLCGAKFASLRLSEGDGFRTVSLYNAPAALVEHWRAMPLIRPDPESALGRATLTKQVVQIDDVRRGQPIASRTRFQSQARILVAIAP